jgi:hypothetical protein
MPDVGLSFVSSMRPAAVVLPEPEKRYAEERSLVYHCGGWKYGTLSNIEKKLYKWSLEYWYF